MKTYKVEVPDEIAVLLPEQEAIDVAKEAWVVKLVRERKISAGKGAELLGLSRWDFLQMLKSYHVPVVQMSDMEIDRELQEWQRAKQMSKTKKDGDSF